jgi:tripartite ATP-independent transporter DctM subunit
MSAEVLSLLMFGVTCGILLLGFPVAFTLAAVPLAFALVGAALDLFDLNLLSALPSRFFGVMSNEVLVAVPLFVFMGVMLERSRIAERLLETMGLLFGRMRGGLGISVIGVGAVLAASTGIVGATVVTMGLLSLPSMLKAGYDPKLATGIICSSGTLGQIIPPSIVLVLLGDILQGANTQAQLAKGNFAPEPVSVIDLFAGAFIPGLVLVALYVGWVLIKAWLQPGYRTRRYSVANASL